ncbi:restriction endonuclease subunit S [Bacillus thermotolerans]|uniref:restriction endonuclease subunit S n=1 Tax=Bacillus thermotolerans TaxID=1221996 RepID=UPI00057D341A|nr:restriction endonuclease subunit S [Bacillus thermotolerans]KKB33482.1 Restriction enzyme BcgI [Bacillus thermotolerans]
MSKSEIKRREFKVGDIFTTIYRGKNSSFETGSSDKQYPYVGAAYNNNGVVNFVDYIEGMHVSNGNSIVFIATGEGSVGYAVYKQEDFIASKNVFVGSFKELTKNIGNYLVTLINNQSNRYSYGYIRNTDRLYNETLLLPVNDENEPDWEYMDYVGRKMYNKKREYVTNYVLKKYNQLAEELRDVEHVKPKDKEWLPFEVAEIFTYIQRGKRLTKANQIEGNIPYISSTAFNNGVDGFIGNEKGVRKSSYDITIANSGSVGNAFYHPYKYIASDHVHSLSNENFNKYHYLFIVTLLNRLQYKYHFNREINENRLKRDKLMLPVTDEGDLDLDYMENYMKQMELNKLKQLKNYLL